MKEQRDCDVNGERDCKGHGEGSARSVCRIYLIPGIAKIKYASSTGNTPTLLLSYLTISNIAVVVTDRLLLCFFYEPNFPTVEDAKRTWYNLSITAIFKKKHFLISFCY
jgi:hypothetical protein